MNSAGKEWAAYVARRNEIETAKAMAAVAGRPPYRTVPLSAGAKPTEGLQKGGAK